jgi:type IV pilus assembly protein PilF
MKNVLVKSLSVVAALLLISACETTRNTTTGNVGSSTSKVTTNSFDKKKAAVNRVNSGLTYLNHNNFERAKFHLDKALSYDPDSGNVHYALGIYYQRVKSFKKADEHFEEALDIDSKNPQYLNAYGAFLCEKGEYNASEKAFKKAISIPTYSDVAYAYYNMGFCALKQDKIEKAEENFRKALNRNRRLGGALIEMAKLEFDKKRYSRAMSYIKRYESDAKTTSESAWLALRTAHYMRDKDAIARYGLILQQRFPDSEETATFLDNKKRWM